MVFGAAGDIGHVFRFDAHEDVGMGDEAVAIPCRARTFGHLLWEAGNLCNGFNYFPGPSPSESDRIWKSYPGGRSGMSTVCWRIDSVRRRTRSGAFSTPYLFVYP